MNLPAPKQPFLTMNFCRRCGDDLHKLNQSAWRCSNGHTTFGSPGPAVGVFFVSSGGKVVLARRAIDPGKGKLDCIGRFVDQCESFEQAIEREIIEETGLDNSHYSSLSYVTSSPTTYFYEDEERPVLSVFFTAKLKDSANPEPNDDVAEIIYADPAEVDIDEFFNYDVKCGFIKFKNALKE